MYPSNYDKGFMNGLNVRNFPIEILQNGKGNTFWVNSVNGSNYSSQRGNFLHPFASIVYALTKCSANNGDVIICSDQHVESVIGVAGLNINVAGVTIIFLGHGTSKAKVDFSTVVGASLTVTADNVTLINPKFSASKDALTGPISITGAYCSIYNGEYYDGTGIDTTDCVVASAGATGLLIDGWKYFAGNEAGTQKNSNIKLTGVANATVTNINIVGNFLVGSINNATTALTNVMLQKVYVNNTNATPKPAIVLQATSTGMAKEVDLRIASGATFVSSVALLNWDLMCHGYNTGGSVGTQIGNAYV